MATDRTGQRFGRLVVQGRDTANPRRWICECDCGARTANFTSNLTRGLSRSCGCLSRETTAANRRTHGLSGSADYARWRTMIQRCTDPSSDQFKRYGGRGITVCARWRDFAAFYGDMGPAPAGHTLDRIDNSKGYEPGNCRWATPSEQANNRRSNHLVEFRGETRTLTEWARQCGITPKALSLRLWRGWPVERALSVPLRRAS
jgi:hypothetical protein